MENRTSITKNKNHNYKKHKICQKISQIKRMIDSIKNRINPNSDRITMRFSQDQKLHKIARELIKNDFDVMGVNFTTLCKFRKSLFCVTIRIGNMVFNRVKNKLRDGTDKNRRNAKNLKTYSLVILSIKPLQ